MTVRKASRREGKAGMRPIGQQACSMLSYLGLFFKMSSRTVIKALLCLTYSQHKLRIRVGHRKPQDILAKSASYSNISSALWADTRTNIQSPRSRSLGLCFRFRDIATSQLWGITNARPWCIASQEHTPAYNDKYCCKLNLTCKYNQPARLQLQQFRILGISDRQS